MAVTGNIRSIDFFTGRPVLARTSANKLGQVHDLIINPSTGELAGLTLLLPDGSLRLVDYREIYSFGQDAVMINSDESALPVQDSPLKVLPLAKNNFIRANVVSESGKWLGQIANVYALLAETLLLIYEVRSSVLDKLLGHALFFPASLGRAMSADFARLVVAEDTSEKADKSLAALEARLLGPPTEDPVVTVRSRGH
jgi:uncharacterized protein YrrD